MTRHFGPEVNYELSAQELDRVSGGDAPKSSGSASTAGKASSPADTLTLNYATMLME